MVSDRGGVSVQAPDAHSLELGGGRGGECIHRALGLAYDQEGRGLVLGWALSLLKKQVLNGVADEIPPVLILCAPLN